MSGTSGQYVKETLLDDFGEVPTVIGDRLIHTNVSAVGISCSFSSALNLILFLKIKHTLPYITMVQNNKFDTKNRVYAACKYILDHSTVKLPYIKCSITDNLAGILIKA